MNVAGVAFVAVMALAIVVVMWLELRGERR